MFRRFRLTEIEKEEAEEEEELEAALESGMAFQQQDTFAQGGRGEEYVDLETSEKPRPGYQSVQHQQQHQEQGYARDGGYVPTAERAWDAEAGGLPVAREIMDFEVQVRHGFVRKVFGILFVQLAVTFGWVLLCAYHEPLRLYVRHSAWPMGLGVAMTLVCVFSMLCMPNLARHYPSNYGLLAVLTIGETLLLGSASSASAPDAIAMAVGTTAGVVFALILFASQTRYDFTGIGPYLFVALWVMIAYALVASLFGVVAGMGYSIMGTLLFSVYLVYDVQLVVGGKTRQLQIGIDDYCLAALNIYLDIINLFLYILDIVNSQRN